jgi:hypothetical protein
MSIWLELRDHSFNHHAAGQLRSCLPAACFKRWIHAFEVQNQLEDFRIVGQGGMVDESVPVLHQVYFN